MLAELSKLDASFEILHLKNKKALAMFGKGQVMISRSTIFFVVFYFAFLKRLIMLYLQRKARHPGIQHKSEFSDFVPVCKDRIFIVNGLLAGDFADPDLIVDRLKQNF